MKITLAYLLVIGAALAHVGPAIGILMIAAGDEASRALGAVLLFVCSFGCGYLHGWNKTDLFKF